LSTPPISIGPLAVVASTADREVAVLVAAIERPSPTCVAFANTHLLYHALRDRGLARILSSFVILNDGIGLTILARIAANRAFPENLNGTDFPPALLRAAPRGARVYLAGGEPGVAEATAARIGSTYPNIEICGHCDGYEGAAAGLVDIERLKPDLILVAMGNPAQERWMWKASQHAGRGVFVAVGALFDFLTSRHARAPAAMRRLRLEWLYRLVQEPGRMWRRYSLEMLFVLGAALQQRFSRPV
jgi:exopolysaccharide biosynthesis WecB/TagA/CpsF family protein